MLYLTSKEMKQMVESGEEITIEVCYDIFDIGNENPKLVEGGFSIATVKEASKIAYDYSLEHSTETVVLQREIVKSALFSYDNTRKNAK